MPLQLELKDVITNESLSAMSIITGPQGPIGLTGPAGIDGNDAQVTSENIDPLVQQYLDLHIDGITIKKDSSGKYFANIDTNSISDAIENYLSGYSSEGYETIATAQAIGSYTLLQGINGPVTECYFSTDARFGGVIYLEEATTIALSDFGSYKLAAYKVTSATDTSRLSYIGFYSAEIEINPGYYLFFVKKQDESNMTAADLPQIVLQKKVLNSGVTLKVTVPDQSITEAKLSTTLKTKINNAANTVVTPDGTTIKKVGSTLTADGAAINISGNSTITSILSRLSALE